MSNESYASSISGSGPAREFLKLLEHRAPEVRGLAAKLAGKLAGRVSLAPSVVSAVRGLAEDEDARVRALAAGALPGLEKGLQGGRRSASGAGLIVAHGGYEELASFRTTKILYKGTKVFCDRFIGPRSRTHDQMVQAARSGKQNIVEGTMASGTSKKMELKLIGVARASLQELLEDFVDFLEHRNLAIWDKDAPKSREIRRLAYREDRSYETYKSYVEEGSNEVAANVLLCLVHQANYLLDRQLAALEEAFTEEGGFSERLYRVRSARREGQR